MAGTTGEPKTSVEAGRGTETRGLIRQTRHAALGTSFEGRPYVSLVAVACDHDASPLLLLSNLAQHTRNLAAEPAVSLLIDGTRELADPLAGPRLTLIGRAARYDDERALGRFTARHPESAAYSGFADFHLYRVVIERGHFVAGFGRIGWVEPSDLCFAENASALAAAENEIVAHMNEDHADAIALFARYLLGQPELGWQMTAIDPEGVDLRRGDAAGRQHARLKFPEPVLTPMAARTALVALTRQAREKASEPASSSPE